MQKNSIRPAASARKPEVQGSQKDAWLFFCETVDAITRRINKLSDSQLLYLKSELDRIKEDPKLHVSIDTYDLATFMGDYLDYHIFHKTAPKNEINKGEAA